jgi:signal transduction histidine kinase
VKKFDWATFIQQHPVLSGLDDGHLHLLLLDEASTERTYEPGDVIIREGDVGESIFLIGSGSVEVVLSGGDGQTIVLSVLPSGETFGEMGLFERRPRCATVRACKPCVILEIKGEDLRRLAEARPELEFTVLLKVSERLRSSNEQLLALHLKGVEGANRAKDEFFAMLGHELRNPVGAVSLAIQALDRISKPHDEGAHLRGIILRQTRHLSRMLDDLLDVTKLGSGKVALQRSPENLKDLALRVLSSFDEVGKLTRHAVALTGEAVTVDVDPMRVEQVVSNLLDNALKYTPPGGRIEIAIAAEERDGVLRIRDTGVGLEPQTLPRIFDLFVQATQRFDRSAGGLGLGLTLVKRLVELHGGSVSASSGGPNRGSEFVVRLPRLLEPPVATASTGSSDTEAVAGRARHVVIIDDNPDFRHGLRVLLESRGHRVEEAATGDQGLEIVRASRPDVLLVDLGLPGLDGFAVAEAVRSAPDGHAVRLVAITGYGGLHDRRRAKAVGFDAYLTKPVDPGALARIIDPPASSD